MQLRVNDGTTAIELSGGTAGISGCTYFPLAPNAGEGTVAEQAELVCKGAPAATIVRHALVPERPRSPHTRLLWNDFADLYSP